MANPLLVGVDPHRKTNTVCLMDGLGQELGKPLRVANNRPGTELLVQELRRVAREGNHDRIDIATEATGWYWFLLFRTLSEDPGLKLWPLGLYPFNPRRTAKYKEAYDDLDHEDKIDAFVIADRLRMGRDLPGPFRKDDVYLPIRFLTRYRYHIMHNLAREKTYCLNILYLKASEYTRHDADASGKLPPFSDTFGAASRAVIEEFASVDEIASMPLEDLAAFIDAKGRGSFADPTENAARLQRVARESYRLPEALQGPIQLILKLSLQEITSLERQSKCLDAAISKHIASLPQTLDTIPGLGPVLIAGIISEIGDLSRFGDRAEAKVAKLAGFKWRRYQSGEFEAQDRELVRARNRYLRYYFCEAANAVRKKDAEYRAFYERKYNEVRKHCHERAVVLTARKLVRLVVRLLTTNQPYQPRRP
mgnify:CR=1 FL=1